MSLEPHWQVGAAEVDITPTESVFLYGYPHVPRMSTGVSDPLLASAIYLAAGDRAVLIISADLLFLPMSAIASARDQLSTELALPREAVVILATHTHSGPVTTRTISYTDDVVPPPDSAYIERLASALVDAGRAAQGRARAATLAFAVADGQGLGGNRRHADGPAQPRIPLWVARATDGGGIIGLLSVVAMHPTVLHEDSTLISGDFPGLARQVLRERLGADSVYVHGMGAAGNQSPRHAVTANTLTEAERLGGLLAERLLDAAANANPVSPRLQIRHATVDLPHRELPDLASAVQLRDAAQVRLATMRSDGSLRAAVRTAECDVFGAEAVVALAQAAADGRLSQAWDAAMPAEIVALSIGDQHLVGWKGEAFVEYALRLQMSVPNAWLATVANGSLYGYLVTAEAIAEGAYEANNAIFASPDSGDRMLHQTIDLLSH